jgi:hypothetical protein
MTAKEVLMERVGDWVRTSSHEEELRGLFLELEEALRKMDLLRADYKKYKTLHFAEFCAEIYSLTNE